MADFIQTGGIATLHRLGRPNLAGLERELTKHARRRPITLVLPCHMREIGTKGLKLILRELRSVPYLREIVVGIDGAARRAEWEKARAFFRQLPQKPVLLWNDGPAMAALFRTLEDNGLSAGRDGKGRNVWICLGYTLASGQSRMVAVHDCDILTYNRELLARLCFPVADRTLGFDFCKGYYARTTDRFNGRVMRLMVTPLLRALGGIVGSHPYLAYMGSYRYPLAGEFALETGLVRRLRIPSDWALEVGMLAEVFGNCAARTICQSELCENYDHKHQALSPGDPERGLNRMGADIARSILRRLRAEGVRLDATRLRDLQRSYNREAAESLRLYAADAAINGLKYPRRQERLAISTFAQGIKRATHALRITPLSSPLIPNWSRVESELPSFLQRLREAVSRDNA